VVVFVVSVKHLQIATNWEYTVQLLERTLRSICRQSSTNYRVVVVANQEIDAVARHDAVDLLLVDSPPAEGGLVDRRADKARKLMRGFEHARALGASHVMAVDADDCVSRRTAEVVESNPQTAGWLLRKGYLWKEGSRVAYLNRKNFNHSCGSSAIVRTDLFQHMFEAEPPRYSFEEPTLPRGLTFQTFPFAGAVYCILHSENMFMSHQRIATHRTSEGPLRYYFRKARKYTPVPVTGRLMNEFGLYPLGKTWSGT
jgi:hypothetical protein